MEEAYEVNDACIWWGGGGGMSKCGSFFSQNEINVEFLLLGMAAQEITLTRIPWKYQRLFGGNKIFAFRPQHASVPCDTLTFVEFSEGRFTEKLPALLFVFFFARRRITAKWSLIFFFVVRFIFQETLGCCCRTSDLHHQGAPSIRLNGGGVSQWGGAANRAAGTLTPNVVVGRRGTCVSAVENKRFNDVEDCDTPLAQFSPAVI